MYNVIIQSLLSSDMRVVAPGEGHILMGNAAG